jgi:hypothetical protein
MFRSQWPRGRTPTQTLGPCVGIPLGAWMCVYSTCIVL